MLYKTKLLKGKYGGTKKLQIVQMKNSLSILPIKNSVK